MRKFDIYYNAGVRYVKIFPLPAILALGCVFPCLAADWLNFRGDSQFSGVQKREKVLTLSNVSGMKAIWTLKLNGAPSPPVILGHWVTNRGTKELVFVSTSAGDVYAIDADLGRVFWTRHLEGGVPSAPALAAGPDVEDDDDDVRQAIRPVYVLVGKTLYSLHPTTGTDYRPPAAFAGGPAAAICVAGNEVQVVPADVKAGFAIANGIRFTVEKGSRSRHAVLYAKNAETGKLLYSSGNAIGSYVSTGDLAVANGHVCLGTQDGTLYCFGFPVDL